MVNAQNKIRESIKTINNYAKLLEDKDPIKQARAKERIIDSGLLKEKLESSLSLFKNIFDERNNLKRKISIEHYQDDLQDFYMGQFREETLKFFAILKWI